MLLFDARDGARHQKNLGALRKAVKENTAFYQKEPAYTFRLSHSNREFRKEGRCSRADRRNRDPDPVESVAIVIPKSFKLDVVQRKYIDLPGDNRSKELNLVPLRPSSGLLYTHIYIYIYIYILYILVYSYIYIYIYIYIYMRVTAIILIIMKLRRRRRMIIRNI